MGKGILPCHSVLAPNARLRAAVTALARLYESTPLLCPICTINMRIVAFVTDSDLVRQILAYVGESADPLRISPAECANAWPERKVVS